MQEDLSPTKGCNPFKCNLRSWRPGGSFTGDLRDSVWQLSCLSRRKKERDPNMKSLIIPTVRMFELVKKRTFAILIATLFPIISPLAFAEVGSWSLDSTASSARLFQGSATNPESVNTGVARVTGKVKLDTNDLDNSIFDLTIYPADEEWGHALSPE